MFQSGLVRRAGAPVQSGRTRSDNVRLLQLATNNSIYYGSLRLPSAVGRPAEMRADWAEFATMAGAEITAIREM